jgi:carboxymethylenebutenolidase
METKEICFRGQEREIDGYLALPGSGGVHAAVIVIHEIWGLDDHVRDIARRFAEQGFVALAPDLYTGEWRAAMDPQRIMAGMQFLRQAPPEIQRDPSRIETLEQFTPEERTALRTLMRVMSPVQRAEFATDTLGAVSYLQDLPQVDKARVACLGFCMGGGITNQVATKARDLWRAVVFYGENPPLDAVPSIHAEVLGLYGGEDPRITDTVPDYAQAMERAGKSFSYHIYPGAPHAFFNNTRAATYRPEAAAQAWSEVLSFLR